MRRLPRGIVVFAGGQNHGELERRGPRGIVNFGGKSNFGDLEGEFPRFHEFGEGFAEGRLEPRGSARTVEGIGRWKRRSGGMERAGKCRVFEGIGNRGFFRHFRIRWKGGRGFLDGFRKRPDFGHGIGGNGGNGGVVMSDAFDGIREMLEGILQEGDEERGQRVEFALDRFVALRGRSIHSMQRRSRRTKTRPAAGGRSKARLWGSESFDDSGSPSEST